MSFAYFAKKDTQKFTDLLFKAKETAEATNDPEVTTQVYGTIAQMYLKIEFKDKATEYILKAIDEIQKLSEGDNKHMLRGLSYIELGKIEFADKKYGSANMHFRHSLTEFTTMNENSPYFVKRSYYNLADCMYEMGKLDSSLVYLEKVLEIKQNPSVNPYALFTLANIYTKEKQYQRAIDTLSAVLGRDDFQDDTLKSEIYLAILKNYKILGNTKKYDFFNERYLALKSEISNNNLNTIKSVVKIEEKNYTNKITSAQRQNNRLLILLGLTLAIGTGILLYLRYKKKIQKKQYEAIISQLNRAEQPELPHVLMSAKETGSLGISPEIEKEILEKLVRFEQSGKFTNPKLSISTVATQLKTNTTYLSQIVNKYKGKNFSAYINDLRINYICDKIHNNPEYLAYKISYLGEVAGFTSHSTFTTTFRSITGMSPSTFLREADKSNKLLKGVDL